ncbi:MAG: insulinase family protein [Acidobacteriia bacterium]|nr:insulinase family protein [Terriglobia bacterium]
MSRSHLLGSPLRIGGQVWLLVGAICAGFFFSSGSGAQTTRRKPAQSRASSTPAPQWVGNYKSRLDDGPFSHVILANDLDLVIKEHHATTLAALTVLVKAPPIEDPLTHKLFLRLAAELLFPSGRIKPGDDTGLKVAALGGIVSKKVHPNYVEWTVTLPAANLSKIYPLLRQSLTASDPSTERIAQALQDLSRNKALSSDFSRQEIMFALAGYSTSPGIPGEVTPEFRDSLSRFFKQLTQASHLIFAVVGDIDRETILRQIRENFLTLPAGSPVKETPSAPAASASALQYAVVPSNDGLAHLYVSFPTEKLPDATVDVLGSALSAGEMSILRQSLVDQRTLATAVSFQRSDVNHRRYITIALTTRMDQLDEAEVYLFALLHQFSGATPSADELVRAKRQLALKGHEADQSASAISLALAESENQVSFQEYVHAFENANKVTAAELLKAAVTIFKLDTAFVVEAWPDKAPARTFTATTYQDFLGLTLSRAVQKLAKRTEQASANLGPHDTLSTPYSGNFDRSQLKPQPWNRYSILRGPSVSVSESHVTPLIVIVALYAGGPLIEPENSKGLTALMVNTAIQSLQSKTHEELWFQIESLGATIQPLIRDDLFGYVLITPRQFAPVTVETFLDILMTPQLNDENVAVAKKTLMEQWQADAARPGNNAVDKLESTFLGLTEMHRPLAVLIRNLQKMRTADVQDWWNQVQKETPPALLIVGDTEGTELVGPFAKRMSSSRLQPYLPPPMSSFKTPKRPALFEDRQPNSSSPLLAIGFGGPSLASANSDATQISRWLFKDVFDEIRVDEFYYLRYFAGLRNVQQGTGNSALNQTLQQMDSLSSNDTCIEAARKQWQTQRSEEELNSKARALSFFQRSLFSPDAEAVSKSVETLDSMPVASLRDAIRSVFSLQNALACFITP